MFQQACIALSVAAGGASLLLVAGTQIVNWYWLPVLFGGSLAVGVYRTRKRFPSRYQTVQDVDRRLELHDTLSTAYHFGRLGDGGHQSAESVRAQRQEAERLAGTVDPRAAVPLGPAGSAYIAIAAVAVAGALFVVRYGIRRSLDLRPPISEALVEFFRPSPEMARAWEEKVGGEERPGEQPEEPASRLEHVEREARRVVATADSPPVSRSAEGSERSTEDRSNDPLDPASESPSGAEDTSERTEAEPPARPGATEEERREADKAAPEEESDLIRKMQDAFAKLLSKLNIPPPAGEGRSSRASSSGDRLRAAQSQQERREAMEQASDSAEGEAMQARSSRGERTQEGGQQARAGQAEGDGKRSDQPGRQSGQSGIGQRDGSKDLKLAQQLEAMGKLSEILGKRAENIHGEIMVEVSSGEQRLRTAYTESDATHAASGGEIHRDEVPLAYREYIQRYFEEVRKGPGAGR